MRGGGTWETYVLFQPQFCFEPKMLLKKKKNPKATSEITQQRVWAVKPTWELKWNIHLINLNNSRVGRKREGGKLKEQVGKIQNSKQNAGLNPASPVKKAVTYSAWTIYRKSLCSCSERRERW